MRPQADGKWILTNPCITRTVPRVYPDDLVSKISSISFDQRVTSCNNYENNWMNQIDKLDFVSHGKQSTSESCLWDRINIDNLYVSEQCDDHTINYGSCYFKFMIFVLIPNHCSWTGTWAKFIAVQNKTFFQSNRPIRVLKDTLSHPSASGKWQRKVIFCC